jgi:hypothetical protein
MQTCVLSALMRMVNKHLRVNSSLGEPGSYVSIVSGYGVDDRMIEVPIPGRGERIFPLASVYRPALGPTQPPVRWVPGPKRGRGVTLTTHHLLVPRSRISRSHTSSLHKHLRGVLWDSFNFLDSSLRI